MAVRYNLPPHRCFIESETSRQSNFSDLRLVGHPLPFLPEARRYYGAQLFRQPDTFISRQTTPAAPPIKAPVTTSPPATPASAPPAAAPTTPRCASFCIQPPRAIIAAIAIPTLYVRNDNISIPFRLELLPRLVFRRSIIAVRLFGQVREINL